jgi:hypothetical protein
MKDGVFIEGFGIREAVFSSSAIYFPLTGRMERIERSPGSIFLCFAEPRVRGNPEHKVR